MDEFVKRLREKSEAFDYDGWVETASDYEKAADAIEQLTADLDSMNDANIALYGALQKWIPVTEEPPLKVGDDGYNGYLVYANGYYEVADYATDKFDNVPYFHVNGEYEPDVTHYMPLPSAPMEE